NPRPDYKITKSWENERTRKQVHLHQPINGTVNGTINTVNGTISEGEFCNEEEEIDKDDDEDNYEDDDEYDNKNSDKDEKTRKRKKLEKKLIEEDVLYNWIATQHSETLAHSFILDTDCQEVMDLFSLEEKEIIMNTDKSSFSDVVDDVKNTS
ncbi:11974_t:CDS:2, partial [Funneliformis geosporum]